MDRWHPFTISSSIKRKKKKKKAGACVRSWRMICIRPLVLGQCEMNEGRGGGKRRKSGRLSRYAMNERLVVRKNEKLKEQRTRNERECK